MRPGFGRQALMAWLVALLVLVGLDLAIARSPLLFRPRAFEDTRELGQLVFAQCFRAARKLHTPTLAGHHRVVLLGSSRSLLAVWNEEDVESVVPSSSGPVQLDNLSVFGSGIDELEIVSRLTQGIEPDLAILAIGPVELLAPATPEHACRPLLARGWEAPSELAASLPSRVDRLTRTLWQLYGYREFARASLEDFLLRRSYPERPDSFESLAEFARYTRLKRADEFLAAARSFRRSPTLEHFFHYVAEGRPAHMANYLSRVAAYEEPGAAALAALDASLTQLSASADRTIVLLMPESPLLEQDGKFELHRPRVEALAIRAIQAAAARHGAEVVDAREWIDAQLFLDFDHVLPSMSGFDARLAQEIANAIER